MFGRIILLCLCVLSMVEESTCIRGFAEEYFFDVKIDCDPQAKQLHTVSSEMQCVHRCLRRPACKLLNYRSKSDDEGTSQNNCEVYDVLLDHHSCNAVPMVDWTAITFQGEEEMQSPTPADITEPSISNTTSNSSNSFNSSSSSNSSNVFNSNNTCNSSSTFNASSCFNSSNSFNSSSSSNSSNVFNSNNTCNASSTFNASSCFNSSNTFNSSSYANSSNVFNSNITWNSISKFNSSSFFNSSNTFNSSSYSNSSNVFNSNITWNSISKFNSSSFFNSSNTFNSSSSFNSSNVFNSNNTCNSSSTFNASSCFNSSNSFNSSSYSNSSNVFNSNITWNSISKFSSSSFFNSSNSFNSSSSSNSSNVFNGSNTFNASQVFGSCKEIHNIYPDIGSGIFNLAAGQHGCIMGNIPNCGPGGWTLAMKIDGTKNTFTSTANYWTTTNVYNVEAGLRSLELEEAKFPAFNQMSFHSVCIGMNRSGTVRWLLIPAHAQSLLEIIKAGNHRATTLGRDAWKSLLPGSSLQLHCNREGFNVAKTSGDIFARIGIVSNDANDCYGPNSYLGLGTRSYIYTNCDNNLPGVSSGNLALCSPDNGDKSWSSFGYILIQ